MAAAPESALPLTAYFDVDHTLVGGHVLIHALYYLASGGGWAQRARRCAHYLADGPRLALAELADRKLFNERLYAHFADLTEGELRERSELLHERLIRPAVYAAVPRLIASYRERGARIVLVTGSLTHTVEPLARDLAADAVIANRLELVQGVATGRLLEPVVAGPNKTRLVIADAAAHGHALEACHGWSDSFADVPMLSALGHPACVNPGRKLAAIATHYGWPVYDLDSSTEPRRAR